MKNPEENSKPVIEVRNLQKSFGGQQVLKNINMDLHRGENLIVLGKSGSGKSVLIKCIVQLIRHDRGSITVLGKEIENISSKELADLRKKVGFLFQSGALYDSMTVRENLEFPLRRIKKELSEKEIHEKALEVLENVGLKDALDKMPSQLSGGMRKRIALARTIIVDPHIMLYDEPTTGLDPVTSDEISNLINEVQKKYSTSSLVITHDIACAKSVGDRILMLKDGEIYANGTMEELHAKDDPWIESFFKE